MPVFLKYCGPTSLQRSFRTAKPTRFTFRNVTLAADLSANTISSFQNKFIIVRKHHNMKHIWSYFKSAFHQGCTYISWNDDIKKIKRKIWIFVFHKMKTNRVCSGEELTPWRSQNTPKVFWVVTPGEMWSLLSQNLRDWRIPNECSEPELPKCQNWKFWVCSGLSSAQRVRVHSLQVTSVLDRSDFLEFSKKYKHLKLLHFIFFISSKSQFT